MWERIREIVRKELRQTLREPRMRVVLFIPPLIQLIIFGYAVNLDVETSRLAWMDRDRTPASRELYEAFAGSGRFQMVATPSRESEVEELLDHGRVHAWSACFLGLAATSLAARPPECRFCWTAVTPILPPSFLPMPRA